MKYVKLLCLISIMLFLLGACSNERPNLIKSVALDKTVNTLGNSMANINAGGIIATQCDDTFFVGANLFVIKGNSSKAIKLTNFKTGYKLNVVGKNFFYDTLDDNGYPTGQLTRYNSDTNKRTNLKISGKDFCVADNYIYSIKAHGNKTELVKYNFDGNIVKTIATEDNNTDYTYNINDVSYYDGYIYYLTGLKFSPGKIFYDSIYRVEVDGNNRQIVFKGNILPPYTIENNIIFYRQDNGDDLYEYNIKNGKSSKIFLPNKQEYFSSKGLNYTISDGWIYYSIVENYTEIDYKIRSDGTDKSILCTNGQETISVTKDYIYLFSDALYRVKKDGSDLTKIQY
jgi:hypothetical protein